MDISKLTDRLVEEMAAWHNRYVAKWETGWLQETYCEAQWLKYWSPGRLTSWDADWLTGWLTDSQMTGWYADWFPDTSYFYLINILTDLFKKFRDSLLRNLKVSSIRHHHLYSGLVYSLARYTHASSLSIKLCPNLCKYIFSCAFS
jgi:hypothetical protein